MKTLTRCEPLQRTRQSPLALIPDAANCIHLELADGCNRELTQVRINRSFVFGLLEDSRSWGLIRLSHISALKFQTQNQDTLAQVAWTRKCAGELLSLLPLPAPAIICLQNKPGNKVPVVVLGVTRGLIATDSHQIPWVPIQAISYLEIKPN